MRHIRLFIACVAMTLCVSLKAQTFHAILFADTNDKRIGKSTAIDLNNVSNMLVEAQSSLKGKMEFVYYVYPGNYCSPQNLRKVLDNIRCQSDDVVFFYYSGHGYNDETNVWPTLTLNDAGIQEIEILKRLKKVNAKAKLTLCIADCCNKPFRSRNTSSVAYSYETDESAVKKLFTGFKGKKTIIISASKQGKFCWSDQEQGAIFGMSFRQAVRNVAYEEATWDMVMEKAKAQTMRRAPELQIPQYNVTQSSDPFE